MKDKINFYVIGLAQNAKWAKRNVRNLKAKRVPIDVLEFAKGQENEAWNRLQAAKETFAEEVKK